MGQNKLERFAAIKTYSNVLEYPQGMAGQWHQHFGNHHPVTLELACGKGEYAVGLGRLYPERNFIGVDVKGNRLWRGATTALQDGLSNVAFLRTQIEQIGQYFAPGEVAEIWITFPDPQLRASKAKKRLTHPRFLRYYQQFLQPNGTINLKTDIPDLFDFTKLVINLYELELLVEYDDAYSLANIPQDLRIQTYYESLDIAKSNKIHYLQFRINKTLNEATDNTLKQLIGGEQNG